MPCGDGFTFTFASPAHSPATYLFDVPLAEQLTRLERRPSCSVVQGSVATTARTSPAGRRLRAVHPPSWSNLAGASSYADLRLGGFNCAFVPAFLGKLAPFVLHREHRPSLRTCAAAEDRRAPVAGGPGAWRTARSSGPGQTVSWCGRRHFLRPAWLRGSVQRRTARCRRFGTAPGPLGGRLRTGAADGHHPHGERPSWAMGRVHGVRRRLVA